MGRISVCAQYHATILAWVDAGYAMSMIAQRLGLAHMTVSSYLRRRKIYAKYGHQVAYKVDEAAMAPLLEAGKTYQEVAAVLGVSESAIQRRAAKRDLATGRTGPRSGAAARQWQGGRGVGKHGYIEIYVPLHPHARSGTGRVLEHRLLMEVCAGHYLDPKAVVHHLDEHPRHNWPANLQVYASNADHLRAELTGRVKASQKQSIPGAYLNNQKIAHCPDESETLALCSLEIRQRLVWYIESHRPTSAHRSLSRRRLLRQGAWRDPFQWASRA